MPRSNAREPKKREKILVYLFGSLGDSIVAIPALRALRRHFPDAEIVMLQNFAAGNIVLASQVIPGELVDRYLSYKSGSKTLGRLAGFFDLWRTIKRERFDAAAYLIMSERPKKAVLRDRFFFRSAGIKRLYGFHPLSEKELWPVEAGGHPAAVEHEAVFKLKRLEMDGIKSSKELDFKLPLINFSQQELNDIDRWIDERRQKSDVPLVSIGPGCKSQVNVWPLENFVELGKRLLAEMPCEIIVVGGRSEFEMGEKLVAAWGCGINSAGAFSVRESAALLSRSSFYVGLDTGTTHLAAAAGTRCFGIYGERNNPGMWYPLGSGHTVLYHRVKCGGCRLQDCPVPGHPCMNDLPFESVWYNLMKFINGTEERTGPETHVIAI